jgi:hypothetical protein
MQQAVSKPGYPSIRLQGCNQSESNSFPLKALSLYFRLRLEFLLVVVTGRDKFELRVAACRTVM